MTVEITLTDAQRVILSAAGQSDEGAAYEAIAAKLSVAKPKRACDSLVKRGLLREVTLANESGVASVPGYALTDLGYDAIGIEKPAADDLPRYDPDHAKKGTVPIPERESARESGEPEARPTTDADAGQAMTEGEARALAREIERGAIRASEKRLAAIAAHGIVPPAPDFSADTHKPFRKKLAEVQALVEAGDVTGLRNYPINPVSSSPKAIDRYRRYAIEALEAQATADA